MTDQPAPSFRPSGPHRGRPHPWLPARVYADLVAIRAALCSPLRVLVCLAVLAVSITSTILMLT